MTTGGILIAVLFAGFAVSYGWGMRGCIIGGEKGALVPGALLGLSIAFFCFDGRFASLYPFFCAAGALGMSFGGIEPYAQTMSFILHRDREPYKGHYAKGIVGIFLKGGLWYGIAGAVLGLLPASLAGEYAVMEIAVLFVTLPVVSLLGTLLINKPYDRENGRFPKIYFSTGSREEWGGNLFVLTELLIFSLVKGNGFAVGALCTGIVSGGAGFVIGLLFYDAVQKKHNGKYLFGSLNEKGYIDGWKIMEHTLGAMGGGGVTLWYCLNADKAAAWLGNVRLSSLAFGGEKNTAGMVIVAAMLLLTALQYPVKLLTAKKGKEPDEHTFELLERPFFASFALVFIFLGSEKAAFSSAFLTVLYMLCEKCAAEWFAKYKGGKPVRIGFAVLFVLGAAYFFTVQSVPAAVLAVLYTFVYTLSSVLYFVMPENIRAQKASGKSFGRFFGSAVTVQGNFLFQCAVVTVIILLKTL